jgi:hypothetical protein
MRRAGGPFLNAGMVDSSKSRPLWTIGAIRAAIDEVASLLIRSMLWWEKLAGIEHAA